VSGFTINEVTLGRIGSSGVTLKIRIATTKVLLQKRLPEFLAIQEFRSKIRQLKRLGFFAAYIRCIMTP
jgi:hypothetical protein